MRDSQVLKVAQMVVAQNNGWVKSQFDRHEKAMVAMQNMTVDTHLRLAAVIECLTSRPQVRARLWVLPLPWKKDLELTGGEVEDCFRRLKDEFFRQLKAKEQEKSKAPEDNAGQNVPAAEKAAAENLAASIHERLPKPSGRSYVEPVREESSDVLEKAGG